MRQRRVGTFTLGITLILIGILVPLILIFKEKSLLILQFAPIVLVILGIEVLIYAIKFKEDTLKYDGISIFLVIMVTIVSIGTASVAPIVSRVVEYSRLEQQAVDNGEELIETVLSKNKLDGDVSVYFSNYDFPYMLYSSSQMDMKMSVNVRIYNMGTKENPVTESEIVDKLTTLIKEISAVNLNLSDLNITITKKSNRVQIADINLSSYEIKYIDKDTVSRKLSYYNEDIEKSVIIEFEESTTE